jgi:hypothetical protein
MLQPKYNSLCAQCFMDGYTAECESGAAPIEETPVKEMMAPHWVSCEQWKKQDSRQPHVVCASGHELRDVMADVRLRVVVQERG